jgi:hypothetical protein
MCVLLLVKGKAVVIESSAGKSSRAEAATIVDSAGYVECTKTSQGGAEDRRWVSRKAAVAEGSLQREEVATALIKVKVRGRQGSVQEGRALPGKERQVLLAWSYDISTALLYIYKCESRGCLTAVIENAMDINYHATRDVVVLAGRRPGSLAPSSARLL